MTQSSVSAHIVDKQAVQLPHVEIVHAVQPTLWDGVDPHDLPDFAAELVPLIENMKIGDRMMLALALSEVSATARIVAAAIAWHGWISWPGRDRLATLLRIPKQNVSRATKELADEGIIRKYRRHKTSQSIQYVFSGMALVKAGVEIKGGDWNQIDTLTGKEQETLVSGEIRTRLLSKGAVCEFCPVKPDGQICPRCGRA